MDDKDKDFDKNDYLEEEEDISYEKYKLMLETQKEKEINEFVENKNLTIQEKITINLEKELNQLKLEQKNLLYSNEEMLKLDPNDKVVRESIEINIAIYNKNEKRIKEIEQKIIYLNINSEENNNDDHSNINSNWSSYWLFWNSFITKNRYY